MKQNLVCELTHTERRAKGDVAYFEFKDKETGDVIATHSMPIGLIEVMKLEINSMADMGEALMMMAMAMNEAHGKILKKAERAEQ